MKRVALFLILGCAVVLARNVVITNPTTQPIPIKQVASSAPVATPTASPVGTATATPTPTATSTPAGMADGDPVSLWQDSSGWGHNATQTGAARPTFKTNVLNGKPVVRFNSATSQFLNVASPISETPVWDMFVVMAASGTNELVPLSSGTLAGTCGPLLHPSGTRYICANGGIFTMGSWSGSAFHVYTGRSAGPAAFVDGTSVATGFVAGVAGGVFDAIGKRGGTEFSDGDIAEIVIYNQTLALRTKLVVLLTALITTGELPGPAELDAMVGHRDKIEKYLHKHGAHPTKAQLDAVVTPMAVGDRANIEKYLGTKYGITVAGGTAADPSTVAGLQGWWKADSPWGVVDDQWETATTTGTALGGGGNQEAGQAFTSTGGQLSYVTFGTYVGSATGPITAKLYSMSAGLPATLLATSDPLEGLTMPQSSHAYAPLYIFSGANRVQLTAGTQYAIALAFTGVNTVFATNGPGIGPQGMSMTRQNAGSWVGNQGGTLRFAVYVLK
jgi:hypothetical protein